MAKCTIAASQLSSNEISSLAKIFETVFLFYWDQSYSPMLSDYLNELSTIIGLGFTAILTDKTFISMYQERLGTFIRYRDFLNFQKAEDVIPQLSFSIAEMIDMACRLSRQMNKTTYVEIFCASLKKVLSHIIIDFNDQDFWIKRLIKTE